MSKLYFIHLSQNVFWTCTAVFFFNHLSSPHTHCGLSWSLRWFCSQISWCSHFKGKVLTAWLTTFHIIIRASQSYQSAAIPFYILFGHKKWNYLWSQIHKVTHPTPCATCSVSMDCSHLAVTGHMLLFSVTHYTMTVLSSQYFFALLFTGRSKGKNNTERQFQHFNPL